MLDFLGLIQSSCHLLQNGAQEPIDTPVWFMQCAMKAMPLIMCQQSITSVAKFYPPWSVSSTDENERYYNPRKFQQVNILCNLVI